MGSRDRSLALLPVCMPFLACLAGWIAGLSHRAFPYLGIELALLVLPVALVLAIPTVRWCDAGAQRFALAALALVAWMVGEELLNPLALPSGWWHVCERAAAVATAVFLLASGADPRLLLRTLGAACACAAVFVCLLNWRLNMLNPMVVMTIAFGHVNTVTTTLGPPVLAWAAFCVASWRGGRRPAAVDLALVAAGIASLAAISIATERRGGPTAAAAVCGWFVVSWLWRRNRLAASALVALAVAAVLAKYLPQALSPVPALRSERLLLYRTALETFRHGLPFGFGHYGMLHAQWLAGEASRLFAASGNCAMHAHNEFLDVAVDGGPVALLLFVAVLAVAVRRALRVADPALRAGCQALLAAMAVHLMTDNFYGAGIGEATMWTSLALVTMAPVSATDARAWIRFPGPRALAWPLVLLASWGVTHATRAAFMDAAASPEVRWLTLRQAWHPQIVNELAASLAAEGLMPAPDGSYGIQMARLALDEAMGKVGHSFNLPRVRVDVARATRDLPLARAPATPAEGDEAVLGWLLVCQRNMDIDIWVYHQLDDLLRRRSDLEARLPPDLAARLRWMRGEGTCPVDLGMTPHRFADLADLYAATCWAVARGLPFAKLSPPLETLTRHGGDITSIEQLVLDAAIAAPPGTFPWLGECAATLQLGTRMDGEYIARWHKVTTPEQATAAMPIIRAWFPKVIADCERNHHDFEICSDATHDIETNIVRIWGLARRYRPGQR